MKQLSKEVMRLLKAMEQFVYCFNFCGKRKFTLTSYSTKITAQDIIYLPHSGLSLTEAIFNDSAQDSIKISGIWEERGIKESDDITGYDVEISIYFLESSELYHLSQYICTSMIKDGLRFYLSLESVVTKLKQSVVEVYGAQCRANFGDARCGMDKSKYHIDVTCDKNFVTCCNKFNNAVNFRGEPFIPSIS